MARHLRALQPGGGINLSHSSGSSSLSMTKEGGRKKNITSSACLTSFLQLLVFLFLSCLTSPLPHCPSLLNASAHLLLSASPRSAGSSAQEAGSGGHELHRHPGVLEASPAEQAARANPRLPGHLLPAGERRAAGAAQHPGHRTAGGTGTG